jgi:hypothetical protein
MEAQLVVMIKIPMINHLLKLFLNLITEQILDYHKIDFVLLKTNFSHLFYYLIIKYLLLLLFIVALYKFYNNQSQNLYKSYI